MVSDGSASRGGPGRTDRLRVAVLGSTGSIGRSALEVIRRHSDRFEVTVLAANRSVADLAAQAERHRPSQLVVCDETVSLGPEVAGARWVAGREGLTESVTGPDVDIVVNGLVGFAGLEPSVAALAAGKRLALANKESLVAGGELMRRALAEGCGQIVPIDSEHSAVMQCIEGHPTEAVAKVVLTASGGPFRGWSTERLASVVPGDALRHPTWSMGSKITVDSATLANKALEVIEAHFLYGLPYEQIEAVVHPQSIVHSLVEFIDGSVIAQLGFPTMELPILYALTFPERAADSELQTFDPVKSSPLTFEPVDADTFPLFRVGIDAGRAGGSAATTFNAANEVAVAAFLADEITYPMICDVIDETMSRAEIRPIDSLRDAIDADDEARRLTRELVAAGRTVVGGARE